VATVADNDEPENPYDGYETDPPQHYPKPGHGLARTLPPESADLQSLLDDNTEVFQHIVYSTSARANHRKSGAATRAAADKDLPSANHHPTKTRRKGVVTANRSR
jgi:hypothetical protein